MIGIDDHEQEDDDNVVPCRPMTVFILIVVGDCRLRAIMSCVKGNAVIAIAARIIQREIGNGRVAVCAHMHRHGESSGSFGRSQLLEHKRVNGEAERNVKSHRKATVLFI